MLLRNRPPSKEKHLFSSIANVGGNCTGKIIWIFFYLVILKVLLTCHDLLNLAGGGSLQGGITLWAN